MTLAAVTSLFVRFADVVPVVLGRCHHDQILQTVVVLDTVDVVDVLPRLQPPAEVVLHEPTMGLTRTSRFGRKLLVRVPSALHAASPAHRDSSVMQRVEDCALRAPERGCYFVTGTLRVLGGQPIAVPQAWINERAAGAARLYAVAVERLRNRRSSAAQLGGDVPYSSRGFVRGTKPRRVMQFWYPFRHGVTLAVTAGGVQ
jgi:hypothetical protein